MPVANYEQYCEMLEKAREGRYAYPAINVTSTSTANAAIKAFADAKSDGIIQVSTGGGKFASGQGYWRYGFRGHQLGTACASSR